MLWWAALACGLLPQHTRGICATRLRRSCMRWRFTVAFGPALVGSGPSCCCCGLAWGEPWVATRGE
eukprot:12650939-Alexandrium_andersonii.AAC.1